MKQNRKVIVWLVAAGLGSVVAVWAIVSGVKRAWEGPPLVPQSDVPVGPLAFNPRARSVEFTVQDLEARVRQPLNVGIPPATEFILQCRVRGVAKSEAGRRPVIVAVESSYTCVQRGDFGTPSIAEVELRPIMNTTMDPDYSGETLDLETTIEEVVSTMSWGENRYDVRAGSATSTVRVHHDKGGSSVLSPDNQANKSE